MPQLENAHTERDARRIWSVKEYFSSLGNFLDNSKISIAEEKAFLYESEGEKGAMGLTSKRP